MREKIYYRDKSILGLMRKVSEVYMEFRGGSDGDSDNAASGCRQAGRGLPDMHEAPSLSPSTPYSKLWWYLPVTPEAGGAGSLRSQKLEMQAESEI